MRIKIIKISFLMLLATCLSGEILAQETGGHAPSKTTAEKSLEALDALATKTWEEIKSIFKKDKLLLPYKLGTNKHETEIKKHNPPDTYLATKPVVSTTQPQFRAIPIEKNKLPELEAKAFFPRITTSKGYVSFKWEILNTIAS